MPNINVYEVQRSALTNIPATGTPMASPDAFGAQIGRAQMQLADSLNQIGEVAGSIVMQEKQRKRDEALALARANDPSYETAANTRLNASPDGAGLADTTRQNIIGAIEEYAATIEDPWVRQQYRLGAYERLPSFVESAIGEEFRRGEEYSKLQANAALSTLENRVRSDPTQYETALQDGYAIISARPGLSAAVMEDMRLAWRQNNANARFEGMLERATSVAEYDEVIRQLSDPEQGWQDEITPEAFNRLLTMATNGKATFATQATTLARTTNTDLLARTDNREHLSAAELDAARSLVYSSGNAVEIMRFERVVRNQQILDEVEQQGLTEEDLRIRADQAMGGAGIYAGLPPPITAGINRGHALFPNVPIEAIGGTVLREYGGELSRYTGAIGRPEFAPQPVGNGRLDGANPQAVDALAIAGELFGRPLQITSGYRPATEAEAQRMREQGLDPGTTQTSANPAVSDSYHSHGTGFDISTAGMSQQEKANLVTALVQAGFTGFGEYSRAFGDSGEWIHADMRPNVTNSFNPAARWGGWTALSPEVAQALAARGFAPGRSGSAIDRSGAETITSRRAEINWNISNPDSSATGAFQFIDGTWLFLLKDEAIASRIGFDQSPYRRVENGRVIWDDEALLALREDPELSTIVAFAYADHNMGIVSRALGRELEPPEVNMAHFMGATGATAFLSAYDNGQRDRPAHQVVPGAAEDNKAIFYDLDEDGNIIRARTVEEVYNEIVTRSAVEPGLMGAEDAAFYTRLADSTGEALRSDPMTYANQTGYQLITPLSQEGGWEERGRSAAMVATQYDIPVQEMKPFTASEATELRAQLDTATPEAILDLAKRIQGLDNAMPGMAAAARAQLEMDEDVYGYAAEVAAVAGNDNLASQIVHGATYYRDNETAVNGRFEPARMTEAFYTEQNLRAIRGLSGADQNQIFEAARAHYIENNKTAAAFDRAAFQRSVEAVMEGRMGTVNGDPTVLPRGVTPQQMNTAVDKLTDQDLALLSTNGQPPRYANANLTPISSVDVRMYGKFVYVGDDANGVSEYELLLHGQRVMNGIPTPAGAQPYRIRFSQQTVQSLIDRPVQRDPASSLIPQPGQRYSVPGNPAAWGAYITSPPIVPPAPPEPADEFRTGGAMARPDPVARDLTVLEQARQGIMPYGLPAEIGQITRAQYNNLALTLPGGPREALDTLQMLYNLSPSQLMEALNAALAGQ